MTDKRFERVDEETQRKATRTGLIIAGVIFIMMAITALSRLLGW